MLAERMAWPWGWWGLAWVDCLGCWDEGLGWVWDLLGTGTAAEMALWERETGVLDTSVVGSNR